MGAVPSIGSYRDLVAVGRGGFGTVYQASEERFGRKVAIKVIRDAGVGRDVVARFERECLALGSLSGHPNIVAVYDQGVAEDGDLYLVMEFLAGGSFAQRLASKGRVRPADVVVWGGALAGALETAHRSGIVHRDVKPENILFSEYGLPKLVDFGIARMRSAYETRTGFVSATLNHAAPEIVAGASVSPSADVYSLASVLYTMLAGEAPFDRPGEESLAPLIARIATASPPDLRHLGVPPELAVVLEQALGKKPEERFESAAAFGLALRDCARAIGLPHVEVPLGQAEQVAEAAATMAVGPPTPNGAGLTVDVPRDRVVVQEEIAPDAPQRRRWPIVVAAGVVLALGGGSAAALASRGDDDQPRTPAVREPATLPEGRITDGDGCKGFVCTLKVTSTTPLPDGAEWVWTIDGVRTPASGSTLKHTFKSSGKATISVVASLDGTTSTPATTAVSLGSWQPRLSVASTDNTSAQGRVSVTVTSVQNPACRAGTAQLQVTSGAKFLDQGRPLEVAKNGTAAVRVARGKDYRLLLAEQNVMDGVCERATSNKVYVAYLPVAPPVPDDPDPPVIEPSPTTDPDPGGPSTLPPKPNPG